MVADTTLTQVDYSCQFKDTYYMKLHALTSLIHDRKSNSSQCDTDTNNTSLHDRLLRPKTLGLMYHCYTNCHGSVISDRVRNREEICTHMRITIHKLSIRQTART